MRIFSFKVEKLYRLIWLILQSNLISVVRGQYSISASTELNLPNRSQSTSNIQYFVDPATNYLFQLICDDTVPVSVYENIANKISGDCKLLVDQNITSCIAPEREIGSQICLFTDINDLLHTFVNWCNATLDALPDSVSAIQNCVNQVIGSECLQEELNIFKWVGIGFGIGAGAICLAMLCWPLFRQLRSVLCKKPENDLRTPLLSEREEEKVEEKNLPGYVIINIWESRQFFAAVCATKESNCCFPNHRVGHVSLRLVKANRKALANGYISVWPNIINREARYNQSLPQDIRDETNENPSRKFIIHNLDIGAIYDEFQRMKNSSLKWDLWGAGFFSGVRETNCSGTVAQLLVKHGKFASIKRDSCEKFFHACIVNDGSLERKIQPPSLSYERAEDVVEVAGSTRKYLTILKRMLWIFAPLAAISLLVIPLVKRYAFGFTEEDQDNIAITLVTMISLIIFVMVVSYEKCWRSTLFIGNCGGVTPDDISFLLKYLVNSSHGNDPELLQNGVRVVEIPTTEEGYDVDVKVDEADEEMLSNRVNF